MSLRALLNKHKWHLGNLDQLELVVQHRGAPNDQRIVFGTYIVDIKADGITVADYEDDDGEVWIPYHRVLAVKQDDRLLWRKKSV